MRRRYLRDLYKNRVEKNKITYPHCAYWGSNVITGSRRKRILIFSRIGITFLPTSYFIPARLHLLERDNGCQLSTITASLVEERKRRNKMLRILSGKKQHHFLSEHLGPNAQGNVLNTENKNRNASWFYLKNYISKYIQDCRQIEEVELEKYDSRHEIDVAPQGSASCHKTAYTKINLNCVSTISDYRLFRITLLDLHFFGFFVCNFSFLLAAYTLSLE